MCSHTAARSLALFHEQRGASAHSSDDSIASGLRQGVLSFGSSLTKVLWCETMLIHSQTQERLASPNGKLTRLRDHNTRGEDCP